MWVVPIMGAILLLWEPCYFFAKYVLWVFYRIDPPLPGTLYVDKPLLLGKCFELSSAHFCVLTTAFLWAGPGTSYSCPKSIKGTQPSGLVTRGFLGLGCISWHSPLLLGSIAFQFPLLLLHCQLLHPPCLLE